MIAHEILILQYTFHLVHVLSPFHFQRVLIRYFIQEKSTPASNRSTAESIPPEEPMRMNRLPEAINFHITELPLAPPLP